MQQIVKQAGPSRQLFETVNFSFMIFFLVRRAFWGALGLSAFLGWFMSQIMAESWAWWLWNQLIYLGVAQEKIESTFVIARDAIGLKNISILVLFHAKSQIDFSTSYTCMYQTQAHSEK